MSTQGSSTLIHGTYRVCQRLGRGGEAEVYLVEHLPTEQLRAAKVIWTDDPRRQMHELDMMKHLHHPALPQIIDVFRVEGQVWLIMEYISGRSLSELAGRVNGEQFFQIASELAEVLVYLHTRSRPIYHLDIKPSNIILRRDGHLVLLDFGAAVCERIDQEGQRQFGTPGFAAPEQLGASVCEVDGRADLYGFGATMYYCMYGKIPGKGRPPDSRNRPLWQRQADQILDRCLQARREDRYPESAVLVRELGRARARYNRRKQQKTAAVAAALFLAVVLFALYALPSGNEQGELPRQDRYEQLLEQAAGQGLLQAFSSYEEAALLQPCGNWYRELMDRIMEDYCFTSDEEAALNSLLYLAVTEEGQTVAECMQEQPETYAEFAYRLGLAYWYFYEETGGKSAAANWFSQAVRLQAECAEQPEWLESAQLYVRLGSYYEKLGRQDETGMSRTDYGTCWYDLKHLWQQASLQQESIGIRRQAATELVSCLIMGAYEVRQSGEDLETIRGILGEVEAVFQEAWTKEEEKEVAEEYYRDAAAAVERVFADEGGLEVDTEQKAEETSDSAGGT
jgi:serine/threonine-protein kinase